MAKESVNQTHIKITASASQAIGEFSRADNELRRSVGRMEAEASRFAKRLGDKFSFGDIGKDIAKGLGIGSGFAAAETAVGMLTDHYREQAELAKLIEESTAATLGSTLRMISLRQSDDQKRAVLERQFREKGKELEAARNVSRTTSTLGADFKVRTGTRDYTAEEAAAVARLTQEYQALGEQLDKVDFETRAAAQAETVKAATTDQTRRIAALTAGLTAQEKQFEVMLEARQRANAETEKQRAADERLAQTYRELADPAERYRVQIAELNRLHGEGRVGAEAYAAALAKLQEGAVGASLTSFFGKIDEISARTEQTKDFAKDLGLTFSSAFEDAIVRAEEFSDVLRGLAQDVLRLFVRKTITAPMANMLGDFFGGFFADGGRPPVGRPSIVGEEGPELFVPDSAGTIVPNHALGGGGGGGASFTFNYSFASGVTRQEVAGMLPQLVEASKRAVGEALQRGGGYRRALA